RPGGDRAPHLGWGAPPVAFSSGLAEAAAEYQAPLAPSPTLPRDAGEGRGGAFGLAVAAPPAAAPPAAPLEPPSSPLRAARAQLHETYIVAQTDDGIVIVDQHAAHERLVYERMKRDMADRGVARQMLLLPEVVELEDAAAARLAARAGELAELGLVLEPF